MTVTANASNDELAVPGEGGGVHVTSGTFTVANTIIAGNTDKSGTNHPDASGTFADGPPT